MKKFCLILAGVFAFSAAFATAYNVKVETYVGGRLEDKFAFVVKSGESQEKGYDGKYLAKRFLAKGFVNRNVELEQLRAGEAKLAEAEAEKSLSTKVEELLTAERVNLSNAEKRAEASAAQNALSTEKIAALEQIKEAFATSERSAKKLFEEFAQKYSLSAQDKKDAQKLARLSRVKYSDYEEFDVGSYCKMRAVKVLGANQVRFEISYAYSRLLSYSYHDGLNSDNSITKYPVFEIFERLHTPAKITLGKPYCIQFTRPKSAEEAKTIQDALSKTTLFAGGAPATGSDSPVVSVPTLKHGELDAKGSFEKIQNKYSARTGETVRAVFTVTLAK